MPWFRDVVGETKISYSTEDRKIEINYEDGVTTTHFPDENTFNSIVASILVFGMKNSKEILEKVISLMVKAGDLPSIS